MSFISYKKKTNQREKKKNTEEEKYLMHQDARM
jgi:hypothetical protein